MTLFAGLSKIETPETIQPDKKGQADVELCVGLKHRAPKAQ